MPQRCVAIAFAVFAFSCSTAKQAVTPPSAWAQDPLWRAGIMLEHGSGWVLRTKTPKFYEKRTWVVTAYHVVDASPHQMVTFWSTNDRDEPQPGYASGFVMHYNQQLDVALIMVYGVSARGLDVAQARPAVGVPVLGCGVIFRRGEGGQLPWATLFGVVRKHYNFDDRSGRPLLETTAAVFYGFSGGAFVDPVTGEVVGLIQLKHSDRSNPTWGLPCDALRAWIRSLGDPTLEIY